MISFRVWGWQEAEKGKREGLVGGGVHSPQAPGSVAGRSFPAAAGSLQLGGVV